MKKGDVSPLMWIVLGLMVLLACIGVVIVLRGKSLGIVDAIAKAFS